MFDEVFKKLKGLKEHAEREGRKAGQNKYLVNLPPLSGLFFHEPRVNAGHDFIKVLAEIEGLTINRSEASLERAHK
jgi:hypothetical protein